MFNFVLSFGIIWGNKFCVRLLSTQRLQSNSTATAVKKNTEVNNYGYSGTLKIVYALCIISHWQWYFASEFPERKWVQSGLSQTHSSPERQSTGLRDDSHSLHLTEVKVERKTASTFVQAVLLIPIDCIGSAGYK